MSAVKSKFAGLLRGLWRHFDDEEPVAPANTFEPAAPAVAVAAAPVVIDAVEPVSSAPASEPAAPPIPAYVPPPAPVAPPAPAKAAGIELPLQPILAVLPLELRAKVTAPGASSMKISIPAEKILSQLATGSVKISFGELRQLAPGVFANYGGEHDAKSVALPLSQILAQINPALLARRPMQKRVEVSDEVASPFDALGSGLKISTEKMKAPPAALPVEPPPLSRFAAPITEKPAQPMPVTPPPPNFAPRWTAPATNASSGNGGSNGSNSPRPAAGFDASPTAAIPIPERPAPTPVATPLLVSIAEISENWPEALRQEISLFNLESAQVSLPLNLVEPALKRGRVVFPWRDLRSWIKSAAVAASAHDNTELELPLKVLAPLFFARQKAGAASQKKVSVAAEIPDLFFGSNQKAAEPPAPPLPPVPSAVAAAIPSQDTNFLLRSIQPQTSDSEFKRKEGTDFKSRGAAPADVVARAVKLPGVAGALITLSDGLKVAGEIPAELNGDTLAAFIPQIFTKVNQGSRELRMGELNNLSFTVGNVSWKIFRVNAVYFAAFGRKNESLPGAPLAALAIELDHKK